MKKRMLALAMALILCAGLTPPALAMPSAEDYGKWIGGNDPECTHPTEKQSVLGDYPDETPNNGKHVHVIECQCGAQFLTLEECKDNNGDKKCDGCNQNMPVEATSIADASVKVNTMFPNNTEYLMGSDG